MDRSSVIEAAQYGQFNNPAVQETRCWSLFFAPPFDKQGCNKTQFVLKCLAEGLVILMLVIIISLTIGMIVKCSKR